MKARVKSTGEIVEIKDLYDDGFYRNGCKDYKKIDNE